MLTYTEYTNFLKKEKEKIFELSDFSKENILSTDKNYLSHKRGKILKFIDDFSFQKNQIYKQLPDNLFSKFQKLQNNDKRLNIDESRTEILFNE